MPLHEADDWFDDVEEEEEKEVNSPTISLIDTKCDKGVEEEEEEEEEDYLSMDLEALEKATEAKRPKREETYSEKRRREIEAQRLRGYIKPIKEREAERRQEGLSRPVEATNRGLSLLKRMGYTMRSRRTGLGLEDEETLEGRSGHSRGSKRDLEEENGDTERDFRTRQQAHYVARRMAGDVLRARAAAERLDRSKELDELEEEEKGREEDIPPPFELLPTDEQLERTTQYLREKHHYCLWCGDTYDTLKDLEELCPGNTYEDHAD
ncbi:MAG: hypothetical protein DHS80DRAFT_32621 [Piptocephalis tieghemiana]|nr:MAG: hypothetical protein DHS80DRAFT_32621 [Piptocephalis tieghemiana]